MPIFNLTNAPKAFMKLGQIRKGDRGGKNGAPRDLDYFRVTFLPGRHAAALEARFREVYGDKPVSLNIRFADPDISQVWDANYECYRQGGLVAKAGSNESGLYWQFYRSPVNSEVLVRNGSPVGSEGREFFDKPIDINEPVYYNSKNEGVFLEPVGRLQVVIPELADIAVGYFIFQPGSPRDIRSISAELAAFDGIARSGGKTINGIPFRLIRRQEEVTKVIDGNMTKGTSWVVHLDAGGEWGRKALEVIERLALPEIIEADYEVIENGIGEDDPFGDIVEPETVEPEQRKALPQPSQQQSSQPKPSQPKATQPQAGAEVDYEKLHAELWREASKLGLLAVKSNVDLWAIRAGSSQDAIREKYEALLRAVNAKKGAA